MTRIFALVLIICALIATTAFANTFGLNSGADAGQANISSGSADVDACDDSLSVDLVGGKWNAEAQDYDLRGVVVTTDNKSCIGDNVSVDLLDAAGESIATVTGTFTDATLTIPVSGVLVGPVHGVAVMVDTN